MAVDLLLFNLVGLLTAGIAFKAPILTDRISAISIGLAALIWSLGSFFQLGTLFFGCRYQMAYLIFVTRFFIH